MEEFEYPKYDPSKDSVLEIRNSFCNLQNFPLKVYETVSEALYYHNDIEAEEINLWNQVKIAKAKKQHRKKHAILALIKKLKATEHVYWLKGTEFPTGLMNIVRDVIRTMADYYEEDKRVRPKKSPIDLGFITENYEPRHYQASIIKLGIAHRRGVFEAAVGTGKTLPMQCLIRDLNVITLVIVPSLPLKKQHDAQLMKYFGRYKYQQVSTADVRKSKKLKPIRLVTIQTMAALLKSGELHKLVHDVGAMHIDEFHHAGAESYTSLLGALDHIYYRFGYTGTFMRNDSKTLDMWGFLSNKLYSYPAKQAIAEGFLTPLKVHCHRLIGQRKNRYFTEYNWNYCKSPELGKKIRDIIRHYDSDQQVLILVNRKDKAGAVYHKYLNLHKIKNTYISGDDKPEVIEQAIHDFNDGKIKVLIGSQVVGEGVDICSTDHLIMAQGGKSEIAIVQATGRVVRLFDGKSIAHLHDFVFEDTKYMENHFIQRLDIYSRNFDPEFVIGY